MHIYLIFTVIFLRIEPTSLYQHVSENLRKKLDAEERNALCCHYKLECCLEPDVQKTTTFEIKSIVTDCPNLKCTNWTTNHKIVVQHNKTEDEKLVECRQKLLLTIRMINSGIPSDKSEYVVIDHVTDAETLKKVRILNPYVVRIRQAPILQIYGLRFERAVNGEPKERVLNKHDENYGGCNIGPENPTCGIVENNGRIVPFSAGFCCSCNPEKNRLVEDAEAVQWPLDAGVPGYHKKHPGENNYEHYKNYGFTGTDGKMVYGRSQKRADKSVNYGQFTELKDGKFRQRRGGQSCDDVDFSALPESFLESTHCLTFSSLWYSVYELNKPEILHKLRVQIFQKYEDCHGDTHWLDLTLGKVIEIGTHQPNYIDKDFIAKYSSDDVDENDSLLDYKNFKLVIPERRVEDPNQFMMLPKKMLSEDGKECDKIGVGYEAFYKQKKRCALPQGSCLGNQPNQLYESDIQAEKEGRLGNYFLKFFGIVAQDPVVYNTTGHVDYIKMVHTKPFVSNLYFELNADLVTLLKPNAFATITEVYTEATNPSKINLVVKVTNSGLLYGVFYVRLSGCPVNVPASFNNIASKSALISPQHQHVFNLFIEYPLSTKEVYCSIHVHNINQELVAVRQIRIRTYDRCICIWHCECACYVADKGLKCTPMSLDNYHAAGFQGGFSTPTPLVEYSYLDEMLALLFNMFIILVLTLLAMGLVKALLGLLSQEIGVWGLDTVLGIERPDVVCDNEDCEFKKGIGISSAAQFCLNILFFLLYPLALINIVIKKMCSSVYTMEDEKCSCEDRWVDYDCAEVCKKTQSTEEKNSGFSLKYTTSEEKSTATEPNNEDKSEEFK